MLVSDEQSKNVDFIIDSRPLGIVMLVSFEQSENASSKMLINCEFSGKVTLVSDEQP